MSATELADVQVTSAEELKKYVGQEVSVGQWLLITQEMVNKFADATGDFQFIHVDPERAKQTMFGGTIAHGYLTLSMLAGYLTKDSIGLKVKLGGRLGINYGLNKVRFISPVPVGKRIRAHRKLIAVEEDPNKRWLQTTNEVTVEVEGNDRPAMIAETIGRTYF